MIWRLWKPLLNRSCSISISTSHRHPRGERHGSHAFSTFRIRNDTRKPLSPSSLTPDPLVKVWIPELIIRTVYLCLQSFVVACYLAVHNAPSPDKCFRIWLTHLRGRASDKRLIFLRANDLRIPDVLRLLPLPPPPHLLPISLLLSFPAVAAAA